jgi:hypothetical protein
MASALPPSDLSSAPAKTESTTLATSSPAPSISDRLNVPDQFDPKWETDKWEIWSYYTYYVGNNGLTLFNFAPTAFQNLLAQTSGRSGTLRFVGQERSVNSIVLLCNGNSFAIQIVVFLFLGSFAGEN